MIVLDTHVWVWWVAQNPKLGSRQLETIRNSIEAGIGISAISCWEVAKLVEYKRLGFDIPLLEWMQQALNYPGVQLLPLTPDIAVTSTQLPGEFHKDPADQIIVATARHYSCPLVTQDKKIIDYPHVEVID